MISFATYLLHATYLYPVGPDMCYPMMVCIICYASSRHIPIGCARQGDLLVVLLCPSLALDGLHFEFRANMDLSPGITLYSLVFQGWNVISQISWAPIKYCSDDVIGHGRNCPYQHAVAISES